MKNNVIIRFLKENIKLLIIIIIFILLIIGSKIFKAIKIKKIESIPIVGIEATCDYKFNSSTNLIDNLSRFDIVVERENGKKYKLQDRSNIKLSQEYANPYGKSTDIELVYTDSDNKEFKCNVKIYNKREKVVGFQCGYPNVEDVVAVLYSNGELCFEGTGDTLVFYEDEYPWLTKWWEEVGIKEEDATPVKAVIFEDDVKPTNLNYAFENCESLVYVGKIPSSVRTMVKTFAGCYNLKYGADISEAENLLNMNCTYEGCYSLIDSNVIPKNVRIAKKCFKDCENLQVCADMANAENLVIIDNMYENCQKLTYVKLREGISSMKYTFSECINLKHISDFPTESIRNMEGTFSGDVSLVKFEYEISPKVQNISNCFYGCEILSGEIKINCEVDDFVKVFEGACQATKVNLIGKSKILNAYGNTNDTGNVYVNGIKPDINIKSYEDIINQ